MLKKTGIRVRMNCLGDGFNQTNWSIDLTAFFSSLSPHYVDTFRIPIHFSYNCYRIQCHPAVKVQGYFESLLMRVTWLGRNASY